MSASPSHRDERALPLSLRNGAVRVQVRVAPKASADAIRGLHREADGTVSLKVSVTSAPEAGKANAAVIRTLAKAWKLPKSSLSVALGQKDRLKSIEIAGEARAISAHIAHCLEAISAPLEA